MGELLAKLGKIWNDFTGKTRDTETRTLFGEWHGLMETFAGRLEKLENAYELIREKAESAVSLAWKMEKRGKWMIAAVVISLASIIFNIVLLVLFLTHGR